MNVCYNVHITGVAKRVDWCILNVNNRGDYLWAGVQLTFDEQIIKIGRDLALLDAWYA